MYLLILGYLFVIFIGIRIVVPYYGFKISKVPNRIPQDFQHIIDGLNKSNVSDSDFVKQCYEYLTKQYYGSRFEIFPQWKLAFSNIFEIKKGFLPCNVFNQLLRTMLIASGRFSESDVKTQVVLLNFFIHQYLKVNVDGKWIAIDPSYKNYGIPYGKRAILFA